MRRFGFTSTAESPGFPVEGDVGLFPGFRRKGRLGALDGGCGTEGRGIVRGGAFRSSVAVSVSGEIDQLFSPELSREEIERAVCDAANDLSGSVSRESLPEMAIKLAAVRLERCPPGQRVRRG
jgi:hypothetical protein